MCGSYLCSVGLETLFREITIILLFVFFYFIQEVCNKFDPPLNFRFLYLGDLDSILNVSYKREKFRGVVFFVLGLGRIASRDKRIKDTY